MCACAYYDGSSKEAQGYKRHNCFRGDVSVFVIKDGKRCRIKRHRKRFKSYVEAYAWAKLSKYAVETTYG